LAAVDYDYPWAQMVRDFKFHADIAWARSFARMMRSTPWVEPALDAADWIIPMPLSKQRLLERGFNQSAVLAGALETGASRKVHHGILVRIRDTAAQSNLPRSERQDLPWLKDLPDIRKAFLAPPGWVVVIFDMSQFQLRIAAHYSRDPNLTACYKPAPGQEVVDVHERDDGADVEHARDAHAERLPERVALIFALGLALSDGEREHDGLDVRLTDSLDERDGLAHGHVEPVAHRVDERLGLRHGLDVVVAVGHLLDHVFSVGLHVRLRDALLLGVV
jgi:hypothetical protein